MKVTVVVGVAALVLVAWLVSRGIKPGEGLTPTASPSSSAGPSVSSPKPYKSVAPATPTATTKTYQEALITYANRRMQFDIYCQAKPPSLSIPRGTSVMLDNRSGDARTFAVGGVYFTLPGYGWKIFTPYVKTVPTPVYVDCGSARNVGTILVQ